jgi:adenine-specific DNA-methyltransferase
VKRVAQKVEKARETQQARLEDVGKPKPALGFKVFRLAPSNFPRMEWAPDPDKNDDENTAAFRQYIETKEASLSMSAPFDDLMRELLLKKEGMGLNVRWAKQAELTENNVYLANDPDSRKQALVCLDDVLDPKTVNYFKTHNHIKFICLERALDTTRKWNLHHYLGEKFKAF